MRIVKKILLSIFFLAWAIPVTAVMAYGMVYGIVLVIELIWPALHYLFTPLNAR